MSYFVLQYVQQHIVTGVDTMEENLKKALSELLVLALLHQRERHAPELTEAISVQSGGAVNISFPYAILYRMIDHGYIRELPKRIAPDGRRRQYFGITDDGREYFRQQRAVYEAFTAGVDRLLETVCPSSGKEDEQ